VAAQGSRRITVGFRAGIAVAPAVQLFAARHPDVLVDVQRNYEMWKLGGVPEPSELHHR
jgi:hypothetical protein